jgi:hypothetical protein
MHLLELTVFKRPGELSQIVDDIDAHKRRQVVIQPSVLDHVTAPEVQLGLGHPRELSFQGV